MIKVEVYIDDKETPADVEAVRYAVEAAAEAWGVVRHVRAKDMSPRQIGFGDMERGEIAACGDVKLLFRDGHYTVETPYQVRQYFFEHSAVNGFAQQITDALFARLKEAGIIQPSFEDLSGVPAGYEEYRWYQQALSDIARGND